MRRVRWSSRCPLRGRSRIAHPFRGTRRIPAADWDSAMSIRSRASRRTSCARSRSYRRPEMRVAFALLVAAIAVSAAPLQAADAPSASSATERVVHVTARRFTYNPGVIELDLGVPVVIELRSEERRVGKECRTRRQQYA